MSYSALAFAALFVFSAACTKAPMSNGVNEAGDGIIGGTDATGTEDFAKSTVALYDTAEGALCTASILSDDILVTAAHCVSSPASALRVIFGTNIDDTTNRVIRKVDSYKTTPIWPVRQNEDQDTGDVAVVKFSGGLPPGFQPAQVLTDDSVLTTGATIMLAGYGLSDGVKQTGAGVLRSVQTTIENGSWDQTEVLIDQHQGRGACHGDSGGPAYVKVNGQWMLWGITNRGVNDPNNDCSTSSAYTRIPFYANWIASTAKALERKSSTRSLATR